MSLVVLASAGGAPGATTLGLLVARAAAPAGPVLLVEADPSGGSLAAYAGLRLSPGLVSLAAGTWGEVDAADLDAHAQRVAPGLLALPAPAGGREAWWALRSLADRLPSALRRTARDRLVLVDAGRLMEESPASAVIEAAEVVLVLVAQDPAAPASWAAAAVSRTESVVAALTRAGGRVGVVVVGERPWPPGEVANQFVAAGAELWGSVPLDPSAAALASGQHVRRSTVWPAAQRLAAAVVAVGASAHPGLARQLGAVESAAVGER